MFEVTTKSWAKRALFLCGCICVALGILGLVLPMMPGVFFLCIAAWCFSKSSQKFHDWLLSHRHLGPLIRAFQTGEGFDRRLRRRILLIMWGSMLISIILIWKVWAAIIIGACGLIATTYLFKHPLHS